MDEATHGGGTSEDEYDSEDDIVSQLSTEFIDVRDETLELLEWPSVCRQVERFCSTTLTLGRILKQGSSREESEVLLCQTESALSLKSPLSFQGVHDVKNVLELAQKGFVCSVEDLVLVGSTLAAARRLFEQLNPQEDDLAPLAQIFHSADFCPKVLEEIQRCLHAPLGRIHDAASETLTAVRKQRSANAAATQTLLKDISKELMALRAIEGPSSTVLRRSRFCIGVRAGFKSLLPGGVVLDVSNSGATLFIEPEAAIPLNNRAAELRGEEQEEERRIRAALTAMVAEKAGEILDLQGRIAALDLAVARAGHARWQQAVKPRFVEAQAGAEGQVAPMQVCVRQAYHPLLLERYLDGKSAEASPVPIDFQVAASVRVVAITGPNTGGKTAGIKTLGVAAIMAKAGLFVPAEEAVLPWFDAVLADIGDEQSLEQSLSTFSGHIKRLGRILATAGSQSLVLLDEVGSGTDPTEGASLAAAILRHLASSSGLTVATTHYAELSSLKRGDARFENASVEFDVASLRPTFRLLWGRAGQSNAFAIAEARSFDPVVVSRARELANQLKPADAEARASDLVGSLVKQRKAFVQLAGNARGKREAMERELQELKDEFGDFDSKEAAMKQAALQEMTAEVLGVKKRFAEEVRRVEAELGVETLARERANEIVEQAVGEVKKANKSFHVSASTLLMMEGGFQETSSDSESSGEEDKDGSKRWLPRVGEKVLVRKLGKQLVEVVQEGRSGEEFVVQLGKMRVNVKINEILPPNALGWNR